MRLDRDPEEEAREYLNTFSKWFGKGGFARRVGMTILTIGMVAPFLLGVTAILVVWIWVAPAATTFTERLAVFGVLFGLLTAVAIQIANFSHRMIFAMFFMRRRRRPKTPEEPQYDPRIP